MDKRYLGEVVKGLVDDSGIRTLTQVGEFFGMSCPSARKLMVDEYDPSISRALEHLARFGKTLAVVDEADELPEGAVALRSKVSKGKSTHGSGKKVVRALEVVTKLEDV